MKKEGRIGDVGVEGETHAEAMCVDREGVKEWDSWALRSKGLGRQAGSIGGVKRSDETRDAGPRA